MALTRRQREVLDVIRDFIDERGYSPSLEEIGAQLGLSSVATVHKHVSLLVEKGFNPEVAYFECMHELKIIVDLFSLHGLSGMRKVISGTAAFGGLKYGERLVTEETAAEMRRMFERIESGEFARVWLEEAAGGKKELEKLSEREEGLAIEDAGREVRKLFSRGDET